MQKNENSYIEMPKNKGDMYTMEFYAARKKNKIMSFAGKCIELENIMLSEISQSQKVKSRMLSLICGS